MAKFEITVQRTDIYEIDVDEIIVNEEWIKNFESYMWNVDEEAPHEDLAKHIAQMRARFGSDQFIEGFGYIPAEHEYVSADMHEHLAKGFKLKVLSEDDVIDIEVREIYSNN